MNVVSANDFLTLFISLELLSFPTYFLIASQKGYYSKEASFKYLITSAISTGVFLFGNLNIITTPLPVELPSVLPHLNLS